MQSTVDREERTLLGHDRIRLRGLQFFAYHGVMEEEGTLGQKFVVDLDIIKDLSAAGKSDQVQDTVNYAEVYHVVKSIVTGERYNLIERLAERIAEQILDQFSCEAIRVELHKPGAPIPGILEDVSVEVYRERKV